MTSELKPYPTIKDTGIKWLGDVPAHWEVRRLGQFGTLLKGRGGSKEDEVEEGVPCVRYGDLYTTHSWVIKETRSSVTQEKAAKYTSIRFGDVLFAASGETTDEIGKSAVNLLSSRACCGGDVILFRPRLQLDPRFMGYAADCRAAAEQKARMGRGFTVVHIYPHQIKRLALAIPPFAEQTAIARFLDHATSRIERYIRAKEKLVARLEEQKQVTTYDAVTGRIDVRTGQPYAAYKPSGVEWLHKVPVNWECRKLKTLCDMKSGETITAISIEETGKYPVYGGNGQRGYASRYTHEGNFALIGRQGALCGNVHLARGRFWASEHAVVSTLDRSHVLGWFVPLLRTMNLNQYSIAAAQPGLSVDRVLNLWAPIPPLREQTAIARFLDAAMPNSDSAIARARQQIELLREYRTRLIADVVTGKLDVREAAARLPSKGDATIQSALMGETVENAIGHFI